MKSLFRPTCLGLCLGIVTWRSIRKVYKYRNIFFIVFFTLFLAFLNNLINPLPALDDYDGDSLRFELVNINNSSPIGRKAYDNKWVGFPQLSGVECKEPLLKSTRNSRYPKSLTRVAASDIAFDSRNCSNFLNKYGFNRYPEVTQEERDFPLAFVILFHKDLDQVLFLLRAIYRSHNVYCLTVDLKSGPAFLKTVRSVCNCFPNVFVASKLEHIVYAGFSRFMADIHCMKDLLKHPLPWRYLINLPGQQFPLKTNLEMVKIIKTYKGANDVLGGVGKNSIPRRYRVKHHVIVDKKTGKKVVAEAGERNPPAPHNFKIVKGSAYVTVSREFVRFAMEDPKVWDLINWSKAVLSPDEYVWPTLHHTKVMDVPGGYKGEPGKKHSLTVFVAWEKETKCASMFVRWICIFTPADLPMLMGRHELFANKFYIDHHPTALHCLDQILYNMTVLQKTRSMDFYKTLMLGRSQEHKSKQGLPDISML